MTGRHHADPEPVLGGVAHRVWTSASVSARATTAGSLVGREVPAPAGGVVPSGRRVARTAAPVRRARASLRSSCAEGAGAWLRFGCGRAYRHDMGLAVLGPVRLDGPDGPVVIEGRKTRQVLTLLALAAPRPRSVDSIARSLWDEPPPAAVKTVQATCPGCEPLSPPRSRRSARWRAAARATGWSPDQVASTRSASRTCVGGPGSARWPVTTRPPRRCFAQACEIVARRPRAAGHRGRRRRGRPAGRGADAARRGPSRGDARGRPGRRDGRNPGRPHRRAPTAGTGVGAADPRAVPGRPPDRRPRRIPGGAPVPARRGGSRSGSLAAGAAPRGPRADRARTGRCAGPARAGRGHRRRRRPALRRGGRGPRRVPTLRHRTLADAAGEPDVHPGGRLPRGTPRGRRDLDPGGRPSRARVRPARPGTVRPGERGGAAERRPVGRRRPRGARRRAGRSASTCSPMPTRRWWRCCWPPGTPIASGR